MTPRRALLIVALVIFGTLAAAYATGYRAPYKAFFWAAGVNVQFKPYLPFVDFDEILSAIECHRQGVDVFIADPCDPLKRPHAYSPLWLAGSVTGIGPNDVMWTGTVLVLAFLGTAIWLAAPTSYLEATAVLLALLSQSCLFAMERANIDLIMFLLVVGGAVLFARGAAWRIAAYVIISLAALLKFYPAAGLALAFYERPRRFAIIAATTMIAGVCFVFLNWHAFQEIWQHIPRPGPFGDAFGGINFFEAFRYWLDRIIPSWIRPYTGIMQMLLYVFALLASLKISVATAPRMAAAMGGAAPMTVRTASFLAGGVILVGVFFFGQNVAYRGIWLLTILPSVLQHRRQSLGSRGRSLWSAATALILMLLWCEFFHAHAAELGGVGTGVVFVMLVREPLWWTFITGLMAMIWAQLTVVTPAASLLMITPSRIEETRKRTSAFL